MIHNIKKFCLFSLALLSAVSNAATLPTRFNNQVIMSDNLTLTHLAAGACYLDAGHSVQSVSTIGATELGYLAGLTGNVQTQINAATTSLALPAASVFVGSASNVAVAKPVSGAITIASTGVTTLGTSVVNDTNVAPGASVGYTKLNLTGKITAADIQTGAGIPYNKLSLLGSIVNGDIATAAAIAYSKLALTASIVNADIASGAAIAYSKLALTASIVNADIASGAAIAYSKLALTASIVNADISGSAAIAYSKLNLASSILNVDIAPTASVGYAKLNLVGNVRNADLASNADLSFSKLAQLPNNAFLANFSGSQAAPAASTFNQVMDTFFGTSRGMLVYRGASGWQALAPASSTTYVLQTGSSSADPSWVAQSGGSGGGSGAWVQQGAVIYPGTTSCDWQTSSSTYGDYSADSDCPSPTVVNNSGNISAPGTKVPSVVIANVDTTAEYYFIASSGFGKDSSAAYVCQYRFYDGTTASETMPGGSNSATFGYFPNITGRIKFPTGGSHTVTIQARSSNNTNVCVINADPGLGGGGGLDIRVIKVAP